MSAPYDGPGGVRPKKSRAQPPCDVCGIAKRGVHRRRCATCEQVICWLCSDRNAHYPFCTPACKEADAVRRAIAQMDHPPHRRGILRTAVVEEVQYREGGSFMHKMVMGFR